MVEAALHGSGNIVFVAAAPIEERDKKGDRLLRIWLIASILRHHIK
jgi:hypothetical protein